MYEDESFLKKNGMKIAIGTIVVILLVSIGYASGVISFGGQAASAPPTSASTPPIEPTPKSTPEPTPGPFMPPAPTPSPPSPGPSPPPATPPSTPPPSTRPPPPATPPVRPPPPGPPPSPATPPVRPPPPGPSPSPAGPLLDSTKKYFIYGPSVTGYSPVINAARLPDNRIVYVTQNDGFTKMVASDGECRYYSGTGQFNPNSWPSYTTTTKGNYLLNVCTNPNCTGCASNGTTCVWGDPNGKYVFAEPYDANLVPVRYIRFRRVQPSPNNTNEMAFTVYIAAQPTIPDIKYALRSWRASNTGTNTWTSVCWAPERGLFVAVADSGTGNRVMTSPNGQDWTNRTSAVDNNWTSVCWSRELGLFVAVASSGTRNRVMTSSNGTTWTVQTSAADNNWTSVCWSGELGLFVAVASSGTGNRVMTSSNGTTWTIRTSAADNSWTSVCWSKELGLFVAVASSGTGNRVMTSSNGVNWTTRTSAADGNWTCVVWAPQLARFCAVSNLGTMISTNGINWLGPYSNSLPMQGTVTYSPDLRIFMSFAGIGGFSYRGGYSPDGIKWTEVGTSATAQWTSSCWSSELGIFCAVSKQNRAQISVFTPSTNFNESGLLSSYSLPLQVTGALGLSTGVLSSLNGVKLVSANTSNATIVIDLLKMYYLHGMYVFALNGKWEQLFGVEVDYLNNSQQPVARKITFDLKRLNAVYPRVDIRYKWSPYFYTGVNQGGLPANLSGRYVNLKQPTAGIFLNIRQIAIYNPQGLRYAPLPLSTSQLYPTRYLSFYKEYSQYLAAPPSQVFNLQTNKGFTALALVRFNSSTRDYERIFDFGNGSNLENIMFYKTPNNGVGASIFWNDNPTSSTGAWQCWVSSNANVVENDVWSVFAFRFSAADSNLAITSGTGTASFTSARMQLFKNGVEVGSRSNIPNRGQIAQTFKNRTLSRLYLGCNTERNFFSNMDIAGLMVYDRPLSDAEMTVCTNYLRSYGTVTGVSIPTGSIYNLHASQSTLRDFTPVNGWGPFRCLAQPATNTGLPVCRPEQQPLMNALEVVPMTATLSSVYGNNTSAYGPNKLINGNFTLANFASTNDVKASTSASMEWMSVDLGANRPISKIVVYNRGLFNGDHWWLTSQNNRFETRVIGSTVEVVNNNNAVQWSRRIVAAGREYVYQS